MYLLPPTLASALEGLHPRCPSARTYVHTCPPSSALLYVVHMYVHVYYVCMYLPTYLLPELSHTHSSPTALIHQARRSPSLSTINLLPIPSLLT